MAGRVPDEEIRFEMIWPSVMEMTFVGIYAERRRPAFR
jgi:hypothetical protein